MYFSSQMLIYGWHQTHSEFHQHVQDRATQLFVHPLEYVAYVPQNWCWYLRYPKLSLNIGKKLWLLITVGEINSLVLFKCWILTIKSVPPYPRSIKLVTIPMIASGNAVGRMLFCKFALLLMLFKLRLVSFVSLFRFICSVASSSLLLSELFPVDQFSLFLYLWEFSEYMAEKSMESC